MPSYALFLGCTIPARQQSYELSARKSLTALGVTLKDLPNMTCCAPPPIESINLEANYSAAAYNISLAEEANLDIVTLCAGCFQSLAKANAILKKDERLRKKINRNLSYAGKEFEGNKEVKHYLQVLMDDVGPEKIKEKIVKPLKDLKVAPFYGCHVLRPSEYLKFDDPEHPQILEDLITLLGAESIPYKNQLKCCGGLMRGINDEIALDLARDKLINTRNAGADCVTTLCPFCFVALDIGQIQLRSKRKENYDMPIFHYSELLALAMGVDPSELALDTHKIKVDKVIEKFK